MSELSIELSVNGRRVKKSVDSNARLLDFLREDLYLTGTKEGCGAGECGTCSVFVNGILLKSCLIPISKVQGAEVITVEGLADKDLTPVQKAFHKSGAVQCGYCIPGMVMAATAALKENPQADAEYVRERLGGNICRCTGYQKIVEAVELARDVINGDRSLAALEEDAGCKSFIGSNTKRVDAPGKLTGALKYAGDMFMPGMLHMKVLRSTLPHARILNIDTSAAEKLDGVEVVLTSADIPGEDGFGVFVNDQPVMARDKVRFVGEPVAAVAAVDLLTAKKALSLIEVEYETMPAVFCPHAASSENAPVLHEYSPNNIVKHIPIRKGDLEKGFAEADLIIEREFQTQAVEHAYLEPEAGLAYVDHDGVVTIHSPSQNITHHRHMLSRILALPINKVRMIMSPVGGGFGGKEDMIYQGMLALAAIKTNKPVRLVYTREESICTSAKRHPVHINYKMGVKNDGRIVATEIRYVADGGAYGCSTEGIIRKGAILAAGPYDIPNIKIDTYGVYTNNTPSGAFRGFGSIQSQFATESILDVISEKLGIDPIELRRINAMSEGAVTHTKQKLGKVSMTKVLEACAKKASWEVGPSNSRGEIRGDLNGPGTRKSYVPRAAVHKSKTNPEFLNRYEKRGRGVAGGWYGIAKTACVDIAGAWVEIDDGGTAKVITGVTEIGEGILSVLSQIAADELGIRPQDITIGDNDTARAPEAAHAGATRQTYMIGNAVAIACKDARSKLLKEISAYWDVDADSVQTKCGEVWVEGHSDMSITYSEAVRVCKGRGVVPVGSGSFTSNHTGLDPIDGSGRPWQTYVFGTQIAEVAVDTFTGEVKVLGVWAAHDVGRAVNPQGVEGQIEGAVVQGVGQALMENYVVIDGFPATSNFTKYVLPTAVDVPQINSVLIEDFDQLNPLGVKGIGEPALVPTIPAIMNAIYDAVGVRINSLPASPEKILAGLKMKKEEGQKG